MLDVEPKDFALEIAGTPLSFEATILRAAFSISSLPNFDIFQVEAHNAGTVIAEAYFTFMVKSSDELANAIVDGDRCSFIDSGRTFSFQLIDSPQPDMTGWSILKVNYLGKVRV